LFAEHDPVIAARRWPVLTALFAPPRLV